MNRLQKNIEIIHDLLQIQHERATTYDKLLQYGTYDGKVTHLLKRIARQSRNCILELRGHIFDTTGSDPADRVEIKGDLLREWHGMNLFHPDSSYHEIIMCCEVNEMRTTEVYQKALIIADDVCQELSSLIRGQLELVWRSFVFIQETRENPYIPDTLPVTAERKPPTFFHDRLYADA